MQSRSPIQPSQHALVNFVDCTRCGAHQVIKAHRVWLAFRLGWELRLLLLLL